MIKAVPERSGVYRTHPGRGQLSLGGLQVRPQLLPALLLQLDGGPVLPRLGLCLRRPRLRRRHALVRRVLDLLDLQEAADWSRGYAR